MQAILIWIVLAPLLAAALAGLLGRVIGRSDKQGGVPVTEAYTPSDLAATIFHLLGIGPDAEFHDTQGRPYRVYRGTPIAGLL